uniref:DRBM domain-containing protein n=1 Tax=Periophthalmus magnuspinnatus TaxID=409849 RepID=A0A3B4AWN3_9GOBI
MASHREYTMPLQEKIDINYKHEVNHVYELAQKHYLPVDFKEVKKEGPLHDAIFTFRLTVGEFTAEAEASSKMFAKKAAAIKMLNCLGYN